MQNLEAQLHGERKVSQAWWDSPLLTVSELGEVHLALEFCARKVLGKRRKKVAHLQPRGRGAEKGAKVRWKAVDGQGAACTPSPPVATGRSLGHPQIPSPHNAYTWG